MAEISKTIIPKIYLTPATPEKPLENVKRNEISKTVVPFLLPIEITFTPIPEETLMENLEMAETPKNKTVIPTVYQCHQNNSPKKSVKPTLSTVHEETSTKPTDVFMKAETSKTVIPKIMVTPATPEKSVVKSSESEVFKMAEIAKTIIPRIVVTPATPEQSPTKPSEVTKMAEISKHIPTIIVTPATPEQSPKPSEVLKMAKISKFILPKIIITPASPVKTPTKSLENNFKQIGRFLVSPTNSFLDEMEALKNNIDDEETDDSENVDSSAIEQFNEKKNEVFDFYFGRIYQSVTDVFRNFGRKITKSDHA